MADRRKDDMFSRPEIRISISLTTVLSEIRITRGWLAQNQFGIYPFTLGSSSGRTVPQEWLLIVKSHDRCTLPTTWDVSYHARKSA